jgi:hypothetical protein
MKNNLSSNVLEQQFGPTEVEILYQDAAVRVIYTKVVSSGQILELSRVEFMQQGITAFPEVHRAIVTGQSMGKAFRAQEIAFVRESQYVCKYVLPDEFNDRFDNAGPSTVIAVDIFVGVQKTPYAHILETYSPAVIWPSSGGEPNDEQTVMIHSFREFLKNR